MQYRCGRAAVSTETGLQVRQSTFIVRVTEEECCCSRRVSKGAVVALCLVQPVQVGVVAQELEGMDNRSSWRVQRIGRNECQLLRALSCIDI